MQALNKTFELSCLALFNSRNALRKLIERSEGENGNALKDK